MAYTLIQRGANVNLLNLHGENSLHLAVESGSVPVASMLIEQGADGGSNMNEFESALFWATHSGDPEMVALFKHTVSEESLQINEAEVDNVSPI